MEHPSFWEKMAKLQPPLSTGGTACSDPRLDWRNQRDRSVAFPPRRAVFVTAHDDFQKNFAAFGRKDFEPHVVNDEQIGLEIFVEQTSLGGQGLLGE